MYAPVTSRIATTPVTTPVSKRRELIAANARDEWCRNKGVRMRTESEFRHPLQRDCWTFSWLINRVIRGVAKRKVMIAAQTATEHKPCKPTQGDDEFLTSECPKQGTLWHKQAR